jgi:hypothetical protein
MLVHGFAALLCSAVLAVSALKLAAFEGLYDSAVESAFDLTDTPQIPFGASRVLSQENDQMVLDMEQMPQRAEDKTIYQVLSDNPK